jgi:hypothetical protein
MYVSIPDRVLGYFRPFQNPNFAGEFIAFQSLKCVVGDVRSTLSFSFGSQDAQAA